MGGTPRASATRASLPRSSDLASWGRLQKQPGLQPRALLPLPDGASVAVTTAWSDTPTHLSDAVQYGATHAGAARPSNVRWTCPREQVVPFGRIMTRSCRSRGTPALASPVAPSASKAFRSTFQSPMAT